MSLMALQGPCVNQDGLPLASFLGLGWKFRQTLGSGLRPPCQCRLREYGSYTFNRDIDSLDMVKADPSIRTLVGGGKGILPRRIRETLLFSDAVYQYKPMALRSTEVDFYDDLPAGTTDHG